MTRKDIIEAIEKAVLVDRQETYGKPEDSFNLIADLWQVYLSFKIKNNPKSLLILGDDVAVMMALMKIARIAKSPSHADNWIDLAGYAVCGGEVASQNLQPVKITTLK